MKSGSDNENDYRYVSTKPTTAHACILMIADTIEATARSVADKLTNHETKVKLVNDTIDRLKNDKQLDEMKVGVLRQVREILIKELDSTYHGRLDYEMTKLNREERD